MKHFGLAKADQSLTSERTGIRGQKIIDHGIMDHGFSGGSTCFQRLCEASTLATDLNFFMFTLVLDTALVSKYKTRCWHIPGLLNPRSPSRVSKV